MTDHSGHVRSRVFDEIRYPDRTGGPDAVRHTSVDATTYDLAARGPLTSVSLVCLVASEPVACRSGA